MSQLRPLVEISRLYGSRPGYVIAGGGNTSFKEGDHIWIKASGIPLSGISSDGFVCVSREALQVIATRQYSADPMLREHEVKTDIEKAVIEPAHLRPSVETSLHNLIPFTFVVHTHPTLVNAVLCSTRAEEVVKERFGKEALYMKYTDPGYTLFKSLQARLGNHPTAPGSAPRVIFLQNHGVFVGGDTTEDIQSIYAEIEHRLGRGADLRLPSCVPEPYTSETTEYLEAHFKSRSLYLKTAHCSLIEHFTTGAEAFQKVSRPFTPDMIVYCKSGYLFLKRGLGPEEIPGLIHRFEQKFSHYPKVILEEQGGLMVVDEDPGSLTTVMEVYLDLMKISFLSEQFGGPHFMTADQVRFIDAWEVENYRRRMARGRRN